MLTLGSPSLFFDFLKYALPIQTPGVNFEMGGGGGEDKLTHAVAETQL